MAEYFSTDSSKYCKKRSGLLCCLCIIAQMMFFFFLDKRYFYPQRLEFIISSFFNNAVVILFFYEKTNASKGYRGVGKNSNLYPGILNAEVFKFALVIFASTIPIASKCKSVSSKICVCKFSRF